ncbi:MAG: tRNA (adenosine(37)-N6)-dimethylallyltransferase MiaA [Fusobacteriaceae bacterium]
MDKKYNGIVIAGPTGVGKTSLSIKLAKILKGEIISADSAQVFKGLDIGSAKISQDEMAGIPHHLIDILEPIQKYSVGDFQKDADFIINALEQKEVLPIIVGGTGLYITSVTEGLSSLPPANPKLRDSFQKFSTSEIFEKLKTLDSETAENIHPNNRVKLERALEVCILSEDKFSILSTKNIKNNHTNFFKIALDRDREILYDRINQRVDIMIAQGLVDEVKSLYKKYGDALKSLNIIGYSEIIDYLDEKISLLNAIENIKQNSRRYAKRQFTWFRNREDYLWYNLDVLTEDEIIKDILIKISPSHLD